MPVIAYVCLSESKEHITHARLTCGHFRRLSDYPDGRRPAIGDRARCPVCARAHKERQMKQENGRDYYTEADYQTWLRL